MQLVREYKEAIAAQQAEASSAPRARFDAIRGAYREHIARFVTRCKGGALAWPPLSVLQDQLRMEQVDAREKILRDDLKAGRPLPPLSEGLKDAAAVVKLLGAPTVPPWLLALSGAAE